MTPHPSKRRLWGFGYLRMAVGILMDMSRPSHGERAESRVPQLLHVLTHLSGPFGHLVCL